MPIFLAQPILWFALGALVPLLLHLLHHKRPDVVPFPTLRFLRNAVANSRRSRRLTQCLAMLLRILIVLLLVLAFSQPLFRSRHRLPGARRTIVLLLDGSASMQCLVGGKTQFHRQREQALRFLDTLEEGDLVALLSPGRPEPLVIYPPVSELNRVRQALQSLEYGWGGGDSFRILRHALEREEKILRSAEIHIFSDFQGTAEEWTIPASLAERLTQLQATLYYMRMDNAPSPDAGIQQVEFQPPAILPDRNMALTAVLNKTPADHPWSPLQILDSAGKQALWEGTADDKGIFSLRRRIPDAIAGENAAGGQEFTGILSLDADEYPVNNRYYFSLPILSGIPALVVYGNTERDVFYLTRALVPIGRGRSLLVPTVMDWNHFLATDLSTYAALFLCNPPPMDDTAFQKLESFLASRKNIALFPGNGQGFSSDFLRRLVGISQLEVQHQVFPEARKLQVEAGDAVLAQGISSMLPAPWAFSCKQLLCFPQENGTGKTAPLFLSPGNGTIALSARQGRLFLFGLSANRDWSDWPLSPFYLILMQELARSCAGQSVSLESSIVGEPIRFQPEHSELSWKISAEYPDGQRFTRTLQRPHGQDAFLLPACFHPGFAVLRTDNQERRIAVNLPQGERQLQYLPREQLQKGVGRVPLKIAGNVDELTELCRLNARGIPLWPWLLLGAFFISLGEELFVNWRSRQKTRAVA